MLTNRQVMILDATKKIFTQKGYYGTTMNAIAEEVGIRKASLYAHFNHKDAIFYYLFDEVISEHSKKLDEIFNKIDKYSIKKKMYIFLKEYVEYCYNNPTVELWNHFYYYPPESMKQWIRNTTHKSENRIRNYIRTLIKQGQEDGSIRSYNSEVILQLYYNLYLGFVLSAPEYETNNMDTIVKESFLLFWDAIVAKATKNQ